MENCLRIIILKLLSKQLSFFDSNMRSPDEYQSNILTIRIVYLDLRLVLAVD